EQRRRDDSAAAAAGQGQAGAEDFDHAQKREQQENLCYSDLSVVTSAEQFLDYPIAVAEECRHRIILERERLGLIEQQSSEDQDIEDSQQSKHRAAQRRPPSAEFCQTRESVFRRR